MKHAVFDLETNGYLEESTEIHCLSVRDVDSDARLSCTDSSPDYPSIAEGLEVLAKCDRVYAHNAFGFDEPILERFFPEWEFEGEMLDTLPMVRARFAHQEGLDYGLQREGKLPGGMIGRHSLEAWGYRLGILKDDYKAWCERQGIEEPFAKWCVEMQEYCDQDTLALKQLVIHLRLSGAMPRDVIETEMFMGKYLAKQERNGWPFDFEGAVRLQAELAAVREELGNRLRDHFGTWCEPKRLTKDDWNRIDSEEKLEWATEKGYTFVPKRNHSGYGYVEGVPTVKLVWKEFNPGSRHHIANRLQHHGWEPQERTPTGLPKVSEDVLGGIEDQPFTDDLVEYLTVDKRLGQLAEGRKAWLKEIEQSRSEGGALTGMEHIHHSSGQVTITHRPRHSSPNLGQVPSIHKPYGPECRKLFTVPKGWKLLGVDVDGLELRMLAHYMYPYDDGEYAHAVLEGDKESGTDVHSRAADIIGLDRPEGKTFNYAYLYGAGDEKLGSIVLPHASSGKQKQKGKELRKEFETGFTGLGKFVDKLKAKGRRGYILGPDGRRVYVRSQHAILNTLLQSAGAIECRWWIRFAGETMEWEFGEQGWGGNWSALAWVHDEVQIAVRGPAKYEAPDIWMDAITKAGEYLGFRVPLSGSFGLGDSWLETH